MHSDMVMDEVAGTQVCVPKHTWGIKMEKHTDWGKRFKNCIKWKKHSDIGWLLLSIFTAAAFCMDMEIVSDEFMSQITNAQT